MGLYLNGSITGASLPTPRARAPRPDAEPPRPPAEADKKDSAYHKQFVLNERSGH